MNSIFVFMILALALTALVTGVLMWVLLRARVASSGASQAKANAAVYRDQLAELAREHAQGALDDAALALARDELTTRLLEDTAEDEAAAAQAERRPVASAIVAAVLFPVLAMSLYLWLGQPQALSPQAQAAPPSEDSHPDLEALASSLAKKLQTDPANAQGWVMLGRTYRALERFADANQAYQKALALNADDDVALERAEVLAQQNKGNFQGEPWATIQQVLARDGRHLGGLLLAGSASYAEGKYRNALDYWQKAREQLDTGSEEAQGLDTALAKARAKLGESGTALAAARPASAPAMASVQAKAGAAAGTTASVSGRLTLAQALQGKVSPGDTVFIYATPANGERMPLAIFRSTVARLPMDFELDDSSAMNPQRKMSSAGEVILKARVSKSGNAMSQPGDLIGSLGPMKVGSRGLKLVISEEVR